MCARAPRRCCARPHYRDPRRLDAGI